MSDQGAVLCCLWALWCMSDCAEKSEQAATRRREHQLAQRLKEMEEQMEEVQGRMEYEPRGSSRRKSI